ncbi:platelet-derived growth factor subunit A-like isoform X2 [Synchiropus splendidus]|uniref:platelet-derived growth factor subunit A-like isoform X2 n=1 Tax=Synchiropus splendidus TaxID=270530 RepID=UPI00237E45BA|nr:platelet-derived growth factor subunit A-like isoform X2 [Synchiropus splendidus]
MRVCRVLGCNSGFNLQFALKHSLTDSTSLLGKCLQQQVSSSRLWRWSVLRGNGSEPPGSGSDSPAPSLDLCPQPREEMRAAVLPLLAGCLCLLRSAAEERPLPQELLERLSRSEVRSIGDLQRLLEIDPVESEPIEETKHSYKDFSHNFAEVKRTGSRHKRSTVVEEAVAAGCKVQTTIFEIPRSLVDSTAANFIIWPPCVEVKRCTGCCNTGNLCCHPTRRQHRLVKVAKVEYARRRPKLREVQVTLEDHLECACANKHRRCADSDNGVR